MWRAPARSGRGRPRRAGSGGGRGRAGGRWRRAGSPWRATRRAWRCPRRRGLRAGVAQPDQWVAVLGAPAGDGRTEPRVGTPLRQQLGLDAPGTQRVDRRSGVPVHAGAGNDQHGGIGQRRLLACCRGRGSFCPCGRPRARSTTERPGRMDRWTSGSLGSGCSTMAVSRAAGGVMGFWICATCAVEHAERVEVCAICADERQWVPADGQHWTTLEELAADGRRVEMTELEPDLFGITTTEKTGIGQTSKLVRTPSGTCCGTRSGTSTPTACGRSASSVRSPPWWPATRTCSASRSSGAGSSAGYRCWWRRRTGSGSPARTRRSGPGRAGSRSCPASPSPSRAATSRAAPSRTGQARTARACCWRGHRLRQPGPPLRRVHAQLPEPPPAVRGRDRARRPRLGGVRLRPALRQLRDPDRRRRAGGRPPFGGPPHRLGTGDFDHLT